MRLYTAILIVLASVSASLAENMDLAGQWRIQLDPDDLGILESWHQRDLDGIIQLPGSLAEHGYGDVPSFDSTWVSDDRKISTLKEGRFAPYLTDDNLKMPCWLQPERFYVGPAWYQKEVEIPENWAGKRIMLFLERPHWETRVWIDDDFCSYNTALGTPHQHDLSKFLEPGRHRITVRVDNRMIVNVGPNSHSVSDHTQSSWNGIVGRLKLIATDPVWIEDVQVYPEAASKSVKVVVETLRRTRQANRAVLSWSVRQAGSAVLDGQQKVDWHNNDGNATFMIDLGPDARLWDEFNPNLYELSVSLEGSDEVKMTSFGLRDLRVDNTRFTINGRPLYLRGTLECAIFPLTGYPPTDVDSWKRIIRICKEHGLNHMRFHSWCPPEAAFIAADELGFYFQVECSSWANQGATIGDGKPLDSWLYEEAHRMVKAYGNHPSFAFMAYGNEPAGKHRGQFLENWCIYWRRENPRALHTGGAGWPEIANSQYHNIPKPRIQQWGDGLKSRINAKPPETLTDYSDIIQAAGKPIISHEIGQWCVYPNFAEMDKYTGVLKPKNFEIFKELLEKNHMADLAHPFLMASGKLQVLCYKEEIESSLRTPGFAGFQLLDLHDFPGQGTALVGVLDPFWDAKPYVSATEFMRFCGPTVPLARMEKRVWTTTDRFRAIIEVSHFGAVPIADAQPVWRILDAQSVVVASGQLPGRDIPVDSAIPLGTIEVDCRDLPAPAKYRLVAGLDDDSLAENDWEFWVYPDVVGFPKSDVLVARDLTPEAIEALGTGGKVLLLPHPDSIHNEVAIGFSSIFWNTLWTENQPPHTLGILCNPKHPAFSDFPTDYHSNWQWWELINGSSAMILDGLPTGLRPLVQPIDDWFQARRLGLLLEATVGDGHLMICSMDLINDLPNRPVARQLRASILNYMSGDQFHPDADLSIDQVTGILHSNLTLHSSPQ